MTSLSDIEKLKLGGDNMGVQDALRLKLSFALKLRDEDELADCPLLVPEWVDDFSEIYIETEEFSTPDLPEGFSAEGFRELTEWDRLTIVYIIFAKLIYENEGIPSYGSTLYSYLFDESLIKHIHSLPTNVIRNMSFSYLTSYPYIMPPITKILAQRFYGTIEANHSIPEHVLALEAIIAVRNRHRDFYMKLLEYVPTNFRLKKDARKFALTKYVLIGMFALTREWAEYQGFDIEPRELIKEILETDDEQTFFKFEQHHFDHVIGLLLLYNIRYTCDILLNLIKDGIDRNNSGLSLKIALIANLSKCSEDFSLKRLYRSTMPIFESIESRRELS